MELELGSVADALPAMAWSARADGCIEQVNRAWCEFSGRQREEVRALGWAGIVHGDDLAALERALQAGTDTVADLEIRARLRRADGQYRLFVLRARPLVDRVGRPVGWSGLALEEQPRPRTGERELREIVDSIPAFIGLTSPNGQAEYFNRFARDYLGATLDELTGWQATDTIHPDDLPAAIACWQAAVARGLPYEFTHRVRRADGVYRWFQVRGLPMRDDEGAITRWFLVDADIEEHKRGEALLNGEKHLLEMVAQGEPRADILDAFSRLVEAIVTGSRCSVMLLDAAGKQMEATAGPSLPTDFVARISGCAVGAQIGPCPMAVRLREQVIAADLSRETRWKQTQWPALAIAHGLMSCWSTPIIAAAGETLGVFAIYHDRPKAPSVQDLALVRQLTHIAGIAIERMRSQKSIEQALSDVQLSEGRLRSLIGAVPGFVWSCGPDGSVDFLNQRWCEYTGMDLAQARGFGWTGAVHPDDAGALAAYWGTLLASGEPGEYEARLRRHDGVYRWFLIRAVPHRDAAGQVLKWYGANTDIDDRKQAEILLAGEKKLLAMMTGGHPLPVILDAVCQLVESTIDGAIGSIVLVDPRRSQPGRAAGPLLFLQAGAAPRLPAELAACVVDRIAEAGTNPVAASALSGEPVIAANIALDIRWRQWRECALGHGLRASWSMPITCADGMVAGVLSLGYREPRQPEPAHVALMARFAHLAHIAIECARWEAALRQSEAFLAKAQRLSLTGTFSWRVDDDEITWSDELYRILELAPTHKPSFALLDSRVHPDDIPALRHVMERQRGEACDFEHEHRLLMADGRVKHVHLVAHATHDDDGRLEYIAAVQDTTQRRQSEEALGKVRSELAHVARVASLGALTASIAHEVNQPLAGIITNANTCLRMLAAEPPNLDGARETARRTIRDGNRASAVIQRLRGLFAKRELVPEPVDLNAAAREVLATLVGDLQRGGILFQPEFAHRLPRVRGDRVQLQQVVVNLVLNALDALGGVHDRPRRLRVGTGVGGDGRVYLAVCDNGVGFQDEDAERLFQAFYTTKDAGMGIGLSVCRSILEHHGGDLRATPNPDHGACFTLVVPAWMAGQAMPAEPRGDAIAPPSPGRLEELR